MLDQLSALQFAFNLHLSGILTGPSFNTIVYFYETTNNPGLLLQRLLYEDIKNSSTFEKFKNYTQSTMPVLFDLVNSMGKYDNNHTNC